MFLTRFIALSPINGFLSNITDRLRFHWRDHLLFILLILFANYVGFIWALTGLENFFGDAFFFFEVSVDLIFTIGLAFGIMQLILGALALLAMILSVFKGNEVMRINRYVRFRLPVTDIRALEGAISFGVFFIVFLLIYTDLVWWKFVAYVLLVPCIVAMWSGMMWYVIRHHKNEGFDVDLGLYFEKGAMEVQDLIQFLSKWRIQLEELLLSVLPERLRPQADKLLASLHDLTETIGDGIPDQEVVHAEITRLQARWNELRWDIAYARFALPQLKAMVMAALIILATVAGYAHERAYLASHKAELTLISGETKIITPMVARGPWQFYLEDGTVQAAAQSTIESMRLIHH